MYEAKRQIRIGEITPVYGGAIADRGLLTLSAGATATLYDGAGAVVAGFDGIAVTGNSPNPASEVEVWLLLDTTDLTAGIYFLLFNYEITSSSDTLNRTDRPGVQIELLAVVETPAVWDLSTSEGKTRLYLGDRRKANPIWSSEEIAFLLTETGSSPIRAAALGFDVAAGQESYIALYDQAQIFKTDRRNLPEALRKQADRLRLLADTEVGDVTLVAGSIDDSVVMIFPPTSIHDYEPNFARPWGVSTLPTWTTLEETGRRLLQP